MLVNVASMPRDSYGSVPENQGRPHLDLRAGSISMAPGTGILETSWAASRCTAPQNFFLEQMAGSFVEKLKHHNNKSSVISIEILPRLGVD